MKKILFFILLILPAVAIAQFYYPVSDISDSLKKNAKAVIRYDSLSISVKSLNKLVVTRKRVITVLDYYDADLADLTLEYGNNVKIKRFSYKVYTPSGLLGKKIKNKEVIDLPEGTESVFSDIRRKYIYVRYKPPYTVEYEYTIEINNLLQMPSWYPVPTYNVALEKGVLNIEYPEQLPVRLKIMNYDFKKQKTTVNSRVIERLEIKNFKPLETLYLTPTLYSLPVILINSVYFDVKGYKGDCISWLDFGNWVYKLNEGRDKLPQQTVEKIKDITNNKSDLEKVKLVYNYVRKKTRYIEIRFGIGGFQPLPASVVDKNGYGDCKALTLYTQALLKAVGIKSYYTLVKSGSDADPIVIDFPAQQFDHVILCVPIEGDTIWLENTSQTLPFNYLGSFTDNRMALLVDKDNSKLVRTPKYGQDINFINKYVEISEIYNRSAKVKIKYEFGGIYYEMYNYLLTVPQSKIKKSLEKNIEYSDFDLLNYKITEVEEEPKMKLDLILEVRNFYKSAGVYSFFDMPYFEIFDQSIMKEKNSPYPVMSRRGIAVNITEVYNFSDDLTALKKQPEEINYKNSLGQVKMNINQEGNKIITTTEFSLKPYYLQAKDKGVLFDLLEKYLSISNKQFVVTMK